jgi:hypothetical protein
MPAINKLNKSHRDKVALIAPVQKFPRCTPRDAKRHPYPNSNIPLTYPQAKQDLRLHHTFREAVQHRLSFYAKILHKTTI